MNVKFYMLCGIPGSGKSYYAKQLAKEENCNIHSSDTIREELFNDVNNQDDNEKVFDLLRKRVKEDLRNGNNVIADSTNLSRKRRMAFLKELKKIPCQKICVIIATPFEECMKNNLNRERIVSDSVMNKMYRSFHIPCIKEGFDEIVTYYAKEEWKQHYGNIIKYINSLSVFDQSNSHHSLSLGTHMLQTMDYVLQKRKNTLDEITMAAMAHDIGKPDTKSFINRKDEIDKDAHYYNHQNVGAYKSLFYEYPFFVKDRNKVALLIEMHMKPYMEWNQSEIAYEKDLNIFGKEIIEMVQLIHAGDKFAH